MADQKTFTEIVSLEEPVGRDLDELITAFANSRVTLEDQLAFDITWSSQVIDP